MTDPQQPYQGGQQPPMSKKEAKAQAASVKAYQKSQRSWFARHKIMTALGAFILLIIVVSVVGGGGSDSPTDTVATNDDTSDAAEPDAAEPAPAEPAPAEPAPAEPAPAEPATVVSAQEMIEVLEANALNAKNTYEGKRVTVSGFVGNIDASGDYFALDPEPDAIIFTGIQVQTGEEFLDQVASFSAGQPVTVTGTINDVGELLGYQLDAETIE